MQQTAISPLALALTLSCAAVGPQQQVAKAAPAPRGISSVELFQTTRGGDRLKLVEVSAAPAADGARRLTLDPSTTFQTLEGIGGSFTEASGQVLTELSAGKRNEVLKAYFSPEGAHYSLTRTHIGSCDFSVKHYSYAPVPDDVALEHFTIEPDRNYLLPMIKDAQKVEGASFKVLSSPWTAPPWMKDNGWWHGGELKAEHYSTFADYIVRYLKAYQAEGIPVWGITPENEPLGNGGNWESLHFNAEQMRMFIADHLGPALAASGLDTTLWMYDQNREEEMIEWANVILGDERAASFVDGMAVHWYQSTVDVGGEALTHVQEKFPNTPILHSEGCIDAMGDDEPVGCWLEDDWYWRPAATDWGFIWAPEEDKPAHPPYRPFYRYTRDLIGGLNQGLVGWIDWNMVLDTRGGPNHVRNYCLAPVMVDSGRDHVYYSPLYYSVAHFSRFMRPGAKRIAIDGHDDDLMATAVQNPDGSIAVAVFNLTQGPVAYAVEHGDRTIPVTIEGQALQTLVLR